MTSRTEKQDEFDALLDTYLAELMAMTDDEVLDGDDPKALKVRSIQMLDAAKAEGGRRRLQAAKALLAKREGNPGVDKSSPISAQEARAFLRRASNDPRFTMAARGLDEMSDEDALRLYEQLMRLVQSGESPASDES